MSPGAEGFRGVPAIDVRFARPDRRYDPGDRLEAPFRVDGPEAESIRAIETSVAWYTEGKGEEDLIVHAFERIVDRDALQAALSAGHVVTVLPPSPLSYEGVIVKIRWCLRVRVFFDGGRDYVSEHVFQVGAVPVARPHDDTTVAP